MGYSRFKDVAFTDIGLLSPTLRKALPHPVKSKLFFPMQDRILNPIGIEEVILVLRLRNQHYDAELVLREKMRPAILHPLVLPFDGSESEL